MWGLLPLLSLAFAGVSSPAFDYPHRLDENEAKTIYVDVSLNSHFQGGDLSLCFLENDAVKQEIGLSLLNHDIYQTDSPVPLALLSTSFFYVSIGDSPDDHSVFVGPNSKLTETGYDYLCLGEYSAGESSRIEGFGSFATKEKDPGATYVTQRVWLYDENDKVDPWGEDLINAVSYVDKVGYHLLPMTSVINGYTESTYLYADIPNLVSSIHFLRMSSLDHHDCLIADDVMIPSLSYGVCYVASEGTSGEMMTLRGIVDGAGAPILKCVVEAFITYGKEPSNGPDPITIGNIFHTWFEQKSATKDELKNEKLLDYSGYSANGNSYEGLAKNTTYSVSEKWNGLCTQAGIDPNTGEYRGIGFGSIGSFLQSAAMYLFVGAIGVLVIVEVSVVLIRKRHDSR